jgi:N-methylhydantoinase A
VLLGVDVGGTFTDAALLGEDGTVVAAKAPTTPADQSLGVMAAIEAALERADVRAADVTAFAHGMTVATNALLEGRAARTALVATEGFTDLLDLGRQARADLYRLCAAHPAPLIPPELRFPAPERMTPEGPLRELGDAEARALAEDVAASEPEAVAVALLHAYRHPDHERRIGALLAERLPGVPVSLSHEAVGTVREFERTATTAVDAALAPLVGGYLRRLAARAREAGLPEPMIMLSSGGLAPAAEAAGHAAWTVLSGPAGGAAAAALSARSAGEPHALCFDMGGTSCDVCVVTGGRVPAVAAREFGGRPIALPTVDVHTVGAGGGSIAWRDAGGALRAGPRSAGADPGPAAYGHGGTEPTVTDANLVLGRLPAGGSLAGGVRLDATAAEHAVARLAAELELDPVACAEGIVRVADAEMARAMRVMTVERGADPRPWALLAFGGAGALHAAAIADGLGMRRVLVPRGSGVLSAIGLVAAERRRDVQRSVVRRGDELTEAALAGDVGELAAAATAGLDGAEVRPAFDVRYAGQSHELTVPGAERPALGDLRAAFEAEHEARYGHHDAGADIEVVTVRVAAALPAPELRPGAAIGTGPSRSWRPVRFAGDWHETQVLRGDGAAGATVDGPAIWELDDTTVAVPPGWRAQVLEDGAIRLDRWDCDDRGGSR